jgi:phenylpropionate dioxygenase-like ring-hydroxylating dioxygenase large terminal subunit
MSSTLVETKVFNNSQVFVQGWYWALPSQDLKPGQVKGVNMMGRELAFFRGQSGKVSALDAYCPHMGAHFKEGKVDGESIRCGFHDWKFSAQGACTEIPCQKYKDRCSSIPRVTTHQVAEKFGMIWIYVGAKDGAIADENVEPIPYFEEIGKDTEVEYLLGEQTYRPCRPEVVMLNAIDAHHFNAVHPEASILADGLHLQAKNKTQQMVSIKNTNGLPNNWIGKLLKPLYPRGVLTYMNDYWYASTGIVRLGPDFLNFYLVFPHRPTPKGETEGHMIFVTPKRKGLFGKLVGKFIVWVTYIVGSYFEKGDRQIFESIKFSMQAPVKADHAIIGFIKHTEKQTVHPLPWRPNHATQSRSGQVNDHGSFSVEVLKEENNKTLENIS